MDHHTPRAKRCTICRQARPIAEFHILRRNKDGHYQQCKSCYAAQRRRIVKATYWVAGIHSIVSAKLCTACQCVLPNAMFRPDPRGYIRAHMRCRPCLAKHRREYNGERREHLSAVQKAWREARPDKQVLYHKTAHAKMMATPARKARQYAAIAAWYKANPEFASLKQSKRRAWKEAADRNDFTRAQWREIKEAFGHCCVYCGKAWLKLSHDHIIPLIQGGDHTAENIVPACVSCNSSKQARAPHFPAFYVLRITALWHTAVLLHWLHTWLIITDETIL